MLQKATFNLDDYEIHVINKESEGWDIKVFRIKHGCKEIHEIRNVDFYSTAKLYIAEKYLNFIEDELMLKV